MNFAMKRMLSALMALAMVLTMMPAIALFAGAAELSGLSDSSIGLEYTEAASNGIVSWSAAGTTINGSVQGAANGAVYRSETTTLTIKNLKSSVATLSFDYTVTVTNGSVTVGGSTHAVSGTYTYTGDLNANGTLEIVLKGNVGKQNSATIAITNISLVANRDATTTFQVGEGGSYTVTDAAGKVHAIAGETKLKQHSSKAYTLTATANEGYLFYGWYNVTTGSYFSYSASVPYQSDADYTVKPVFVKADSAIFQAGSMKFVDLTEAGDYAKANGYATVVLVNSGVVTGSHTIPAGVTLLIPFDDANTCYTDVPGMTGVVMDEKGNVLEAHPWVQPYAYATLTLSAGAKITVDGAISVGGEHHASGSAQGSDVSHCGSPSGPVGIIDMKETSEIVINNNGSLYAWGYVIGDGTVTAKSGATVRENIQFTDYRGGSATMELAINHPEYQVFPMSQYYVQNVEAKLVLEYGATEYVHTALYVPSAGKAASAGVKFIGEGGMFRAAEGGSIIKKYLPEKDRLQIDVVGGGSINGLAVEMEGMNANTSEFALPITSNITINILSGVTFVNQDMSLLPGAEVTIAKDAELVLSKIDRIVTVDGVETTVPGCSLYIYDADDWESSSYLNLETGEYVPYKANFVYVNRKIAPVAYSPSRTCSRTDDQLKDARLDVNGTLTINGYVYTTAGGADICSSEGTGVVNMVSGRSEEYKQHQSEGKDYYAWQAVQLDTVYFAPVVATSLKLHNANGSYTSTEDAGMNTIYYWNAPCGMWIKGWNKGTHKTLGVTHTPASCEEGGYYTYTCEFCGEYKQPDGTAAIGHKKGQEVIENKVDATCTTAGGYDTVVYCTVCGDEISRVTTVVPAAGHTAGTPVIENEKQATAEQDGSYDVVVYCATCGEELDRDTTVVPATGHTPGSPVIENEIKATCTTDGSYDTVIYCTDEGCGEEISRVTTVVPATGHKEGEAEKVYADDGTYYEEIVRCTVCGQVLSTNKVLVVVYGDVNSDGEVDILDANLVAAYYNERVDFTDEQIAAADVNGDEEVDILDANLIAAYYNERIEKFPVEK